MMVSNALSVEKSAVAARLRPYAELLPSPDTPDFGNIFDRYGDARLVLLGEATHGTHEFYTARAAISRRLIQHHGFTIIAVEGDWPDIARLDDYVRLRGPRPHRGEPFVRFPTWMWRNEEMLGFIDWLRGHNAQLPEESRVSLRGLDVYSLGESIEAVIEYLDRHDPPAAERARQRYGCLAPWQDDPQLYGHAVEQNRFAACEDAVVEQLRDLLSHRMKWIADYDGEDFFDAEQNARIVRAAEQYYRSIYRRASESWNLRDRHMFETLQAVMAHHENARALVWAHNSHVGNAAATAMGWHGEFNIGELVRAAYHDDAVLIGFGTDRGTVAAASDWGADMQIQELRSARDDSWEAAFRSIGLMRCLVDWRRCKDGDPKDTLSQSMLERAVGVVYRPQSELMSHYFEAVLSEQFDAYVWFEESRAVTPLGPVRPHGAPEVWPFGL
ncbi:erythromycin esterase family protein [Erythrobacter insulae]|uniref:Erythromycin esterase family protein n=1 Tax=Erythrobacter insulae TaxID=2584124 RepID=A0A547PDC1_9SPHN|nr:erythromycin esterase family protein [Erythrobacter insulae]TRD12127.1 erythromycin esterase family protein [Erythrobacter insulae]